MKTKLPTPEQAVYGQERFAQGYVKGYDACEWDVKKRRFLKERGSFLRFAEFVDYLEDVLYENRRR